MYTSYYDFGNKYMTKTMLHTGEQHCFQSANYQYGEPKNNFLELQMPLTLPTCRIVTQKFNVFSVALHCTGKKKNETT